MAKARRTSSFAKEPTMSSDLLRPLMRVLAAVGLLAGVLAFTGSSASAAGR